MLQRPMTLYELNSLVRETLEEALPEACWVQGELSEGREGHGGHFYGELVQRDERSGSMLARARVTCWANAYRTLSQEFERATGETLRAGLTVLLCVEVTFHPVYGFSLNVIDLDPSYTLGDMARRRQQILKQLTEDGILHDNQALPLPMLTQRIAVVSSATAAGYGDFSDQLQHNEYGFYFKLALFPAVMQGNRVEDSVTAALTRIAEEPENWDVVAIVRGGGATSDLSDFDSYPLAACIAQMPLPVITGIGHERDETVLDYVAHTHLKTPTAVAAFLIEHMAEAARVVEQLGQRMERHAVARLGREGERLARLGSLLPMAARSQCTKQNGRMTEIILKLGNTYRETLRRQAQRLEVMEARLRGLDPCLMLKRGYSMTFADGKLVSSVGQLKPGQEIVTKLADGEIRSVVNVPNRLNNGK